MKNGDACSSNGRSSYWRICGICAAYGDALHGEAANFDLGDEAVERESGHLSGSGRTRLRQVGDEISCRASSINQSLNRRTAGFCSVSDVATT